VFANPLVSNKPIGFDTQRAAELKPRVSVIQESVLGSWRVSGSEAGNLMADSGGVQFVLGLGRSTSSAPTVVAASTASASAAAAALSCRDEFALALPEDGLARRRELCYGGDFFLVVLFWARCRGTLVGENGRPGVYGMIHCSDSGMRRARGLLRATMGQRLEIPERVYPIHRYALREDPSRCLFAVTHSRAIPLSRGTARQR